MKVEIIYCLRWSGNKSKATSLVALIKERLGIEATMKTGTTGQFDVVINGKTILQRGGNVITRMFGAGYPDFEQVLNIVKEYQIWLSHKLILVIILGKLF